MKLYHGTNEKSAREALAKGLLPRGDSKHVGNWHHTVESHLDFVYQVFKRRLLCFSLEMNFAPQIIFKQIC